MCNNDETMLEAYLKYYSQLARGMKTEVIIYIGNLEKGQENQQKQILIWIIYLVNVCLISNTEPLLINYNKIYLVKLIIIFEEFSTFGDAQCIK